MIIRKRHKLPKIVRSFKELKGICVGKCIIRGQSIEDDCWAHCHSIKGHKHEGWICLKYKYQLREKYLLLHEVAHLIACKNWNTPQHGKRWRKVLKTIGGTLKSFLSYNKKRRYNGFPLRKKNK